MAITPEQWQQLTSMCDFDQSQSMTPEDRQEFYRQRRMRSAEAAQLEQLYPSARTKHIRRMETDTRYAGEHHTKLYLRGRWMNQRERPILDEEWSVVVGDVRSLEDLVLECVEAGINIEEYLS